MMKKHKLAMQHAEEKCAQHQLLMAVCYKQ